MILGSDQSQTARLEQNRQRSMRRREVTRAVRDVRERLSSDSGTRPAFDYEILLDKQPLSPLWLADPATADHLLGEAIFGRDRGNDRIIYRREVMP